MKMHYCDSLCFHCCNDKNLKRLVFDLNQLKRKTNEAQGTQSSEALTFGNH